ncbi:MAG: FAD-dependent oxidoreductase [Actinomycetota bacterium]|jgi:sarcosine oxidase|nr:FAD-dependent oxidoreductase [Actinomycetota bacterium]
MTDYAVAVIGRGMIGAAAARHLAEAGTRVVVVGPDEPADRRISAGPWCSHPDEGRITRIAGRTDVWSELAARSIDRYADIAARSGTSFHGQSGLVCALPTVGDWLDNSAAHGGLARAVDSDWVAQSTGIVISNGHPVLYEPAPAGYINPRALVAAQTTLAEMAGAVVVRQAAHSLQRTGGGFDIGGPWGSVRAHRVLLATGAFGGELLDDGLRLDRMPRTTVTGEIAHDRPLPSLIYADPSDRRLEEIYWVPPVRYPDGRVALKIGGSMAGSSPVEQGELTEWFRGEGDGEEIDALRITMQALLPGTEVTSWGHKPCVVTNTPSGYPYIGFVDAAGGDTGVAVAIGGNGSAAKSSDELGRLAASLFADDGWTDSIPASTFTPRYW